MNLYDKLSDYKDRDYYPMHMPGHKRNVSLFSMVNPYSIDITEIDGFDNLHHATGILLKGMERCAALYGSKHTDYLVNGSTAGILTGISACTRKNDRILVARNSHKSVYHAIFLNELDPVYIYPKVLPEFGINGGITPEDVEKMLTKYPDIKLAVITSPTYEGIVSDIRGIAAVCHRYGVPLMVDEAHGAHFGFHKDFPNNSVSLGADIVIHSIHKTLPAFTQTGLLHTNGNLVDYNEIKKYLSIYQSSSPSYILMAGIEQCVKFLEKNGKRAFDLFYRRLNGFYKRMEDLEYLKIFTGKRAKDLGCYHFDPSKIIIAAGDGNVTGKFLYDELLRFYHIQMEMVASNYVLGMTSIADTKEGFIRLGDALLKIDEKLKRKYGKQEIDSLTAEKQLPRRNKNALKFSTEILPSPPERVLLCHEACESPQEVIPLELSIDRISAEYVYLYPPGIPLLVPGEKISGEFLTRLTEYQEKGLNLQGLADMEGKFIKVVSKACHKGF